VIHLGGLWSLIDFAQESGRAGRDGKVEKSLVLLNQSPELLPVETPAEQALVAYNGTRLPLSSTHNPIPQLFLPLPNYTP